MIKSVALFMPPNVSQYGVLNSFTLRLHEALQRLGVESRILTTERNDPKTFLEELFRNPPDCTLSFNGLLPDEEGRFFCDMVRIPHISIIVDSPNGFFSLARSPRTIIASVDKDACDFFKGIGGEHVLFMPHGVEKDVALKGGKGERPYDVVLLASCIDYEGIQSEWKNKYSPAIAALLSESAELALRDPNENYVQAFVKNVDKYASEGKVDPEKIDMVVALDDLEMYIRGRERVELIKAIHDARVDIFGSPAATTTWKKQLAGQKNVVIHDAVPYDQALEIMEQSKIILHTCPWIKNGIHERILAAQARGALVMASDNIFLREHYKDGVDIALYRYSDLGKVNAAVNRYLADETLREKVALAGRENALHHHTWDQRAASLIREASPMVEAMQAL